MSRGTDLVIFTILMIIDIFLQNGNTRTLALVCPKDKQTYAVEGRNYEVKSWKEPVLSNTSWTLIRTGKPPGSKFYEGVTQISYAEYSDSGPKNFCSFRINIKVHRCPDLQPMEGGFYICDPSVDRLMGVECRFFCHEGYMLVGSSYLFCSFSGWSNLQPHCQKIKCPSPFIQNITCTDEHKFGSICTFECQTPGKDRSSIKHHLLCNATGHWLGPQNGCLDTILNSNDCNQHACENGAICLPQSGSEYRCSCSENYTGVFCQNKIVDGEWSNWGNLQVIPDTCSATRERRCDAPSPFNGGKHCPGLATKVFCINNEEGCLENDCYASIHVVYGFHLTVLITILILVVLVIYIRYGYQKSFIEISSVGKEGIPMESIKRKAEQTKMTLGNNNACVSSES